MKKVHAFLFYLFILHFTSYAQFQRNFGTGLDNSFSKVIQSGTNYYILGQDETNNGLSQRATITRLNATGIHQWTLGLDIASIWHDAVLTPSGDLFVVGSTLPFDADNKSLMGLVSANGAFTWLRSYNTAGKESFNRIVRNPVPLNPVFPYYILGTQNESSGMNPTKEVVLINVNAAGAFNWKKRFIAENAFVTAGVSRDLEALPNGDLLMAGSGSNGLIFRMNNSGNVIGGVHLSLISFTDISQKSNGGFYASANDMSGSNIPHVIKFDQNLNPVWDIGIPKLVSINQAWENTSGIVYVTGRGSFGGVMRDVILKIVDNATPVIVWVKYLNAGTTFTGGSSWLMPDGQIVYTDSRIISGGFGQTDAFISVSNAELTTCQVSQDGANLTSFDLVPNSPILPTAEFYDVPVGVNLTSQALNWQQGEVCNTNPCTAEFTFQIKCGQVNFTPTTNLAGNLTFLWNFGNTPATTSSNKNPTHTYSSNGTYNVCVTISNNVTGCQVCRNVVINNADTAPPVFVCPQNITINTIPEQCYANYLPAISVTDLCTSEPVCNCVMSGATTGVMAKNTNTQFNIGTTIVTCTASDLVMNSSTCTFSVTVIDNQKPVIKCPSDKMLSCGSSIEPMFTGSATVTDNCPGISTSYIDEVAGTKCNQTIIRIWTATDASGNTATCQQVLTLSDNIGPVITCPADKTLACTGNINPPFTGMATATDSCHANVSITFTDETSGSPCNQIITRTWTAKDSCGNMSSCFQKITIKDEVPPSITCPADKTLACNGDISPATTGMANATDNCQVNVSITFADVTSGSPCNQTITRTWTARDSCGNMSTCVQKISRPDTEPPVIDACGRKIVLQGALSNQGKCEAFLTLESPGVSDMCAQDINLINSINGTSNASGIYQEGITIIDWTATDGCGLIALCKDTVVVSGCSKNECCKDSMLVTNKFKQYLSYTLEGCTLCFPFTMADSCENMIVDFGDNSPLQLYSGNTICHDYNVESEYEICLNFIRFNAAGMECIRLDTCLSIAVLCPDLSPCNPADIIVPNGLSPNGDNINDILKIKAPKECEIFDISIYNRWGQLVWIQADYDNTWAGQSLNGQQLPDGTYYIIVSLPEAKGKIYKTFLDIRTE